MADIPTDVAIQAASSILQTYLEAGVDEIIGDGPVNWFDLAEDLEAAGSAEVTRLEGVSERRSQHSASQVRPSALPERKLGSEHNISRSTRNLPIAPTEANLIARKSAQSCQNLDDLEAAIRSYEGCALKMTAKSTCIARGNPKAGIMLIGEAPGRDEDIQGQPFVGRAGQLLDKMLASINLSEEYAYITNIVYWRPPGNRTPSAQEAQSCLPFTERQIELVAPKILVFMGGAAAKLMLDSNQGIMRLRGKWQTYKTGSYQCQAIATLHPAYLLRTPAAKRLAWRDLLLIRDKLI